MGNKIKIYLCDFVHNYLGVGTYMFPLNIGYIASYAKKCFPDELDVALFKYPKDFIDRFKADTPSIVAFSHYTWSADLNKKVSRWVKAIAPESTIVFGGPNIDHSEEGYKQFFISYDAADFYVPYQGEIPFANLLRKIIEKDLKISVLNNQAIDGVIYYDKNEDKVIKGNDVPIIDDLSIVPSPYLTGLLDEFFNTPLIPIMETNRGCPYTCTFCAQGVSSHNRLVFFDLNRVKDEAQYIAFKARNTNILNFADSNFGIAERDIDIAKYLVKLREKSCYPRKFNTNWTKNQPRLFEIAKILTNSSLIVSLQSLDGSVLKNVKRINVQLSVFRDIVDKINAIGGISGTEIILGLPGETKESHINTIRKLFDWDVSYVICYNALLLNGTEMSLDRENGTFVTKTKFRLLDNAFGKYEGMLSFETEEGIRSTPAISEEEILYFRPVHLLIQFLWNYRFYFDLLKYFQSLRINPLDYILKLMDSASVDTAPEKVRKIFSELKQDIENEWFDSQESLYEYYSQPECFKLLEEGRYGKINGRYIYRILLEAREAFEKYLYQVAGDYLSACQSKKTVLKDLLNYMSSSIIDFTSLWSGIIREKTVYCKYDILAWKSSGYKKNLEGFYSEGGIKYTFYLPEEQIHSINILLKQYAHGNKNVTLRKMSEFMDITDFFYKVSYHKDNETIDTVMQSQET
ncbi:B12-binding domain-containing radical SAM protein [Candidatus Omnitrophota bacterium]